MKSLSIVTNNLQKRWMPLLMAIIALTAWLTACAPQNQRAKYPWPQPLPDYRVLEELDKFGVTPAAAPHTWEFLGRVFMYHDIMQAMQN